MKKKIPREDALKTATRYLKQLAPHCERCYLAGSLRRGEPEVGDIEICVKPKATTTLDMFGEVVSVSYSLYLAIEEIFMNCHYVANGKRMKKIFVPDPVWDVLQLDLFIVIPPAQWGVIFAIRTGPAEYSKYLVTKRKHGGILPSDCDCKNGGIYRAGELLPMPEEYDLFDFVGLPFPAPANRKPPESWVPF